MTPLRQLATASFCGELALAARLRSIARRLPDGTPDRHRIQRQARLCLRHAARIRRLGLLSHQRTPQ